MPRSKGFSLCLSEKLINWALARSLSAFPVESGCCAQSFFAGGRYSVHETGMESVLNPRHADVLVLTGALSNKIVPVFCGEWVWRSKFMTRCPNKSLLWLWVRVRATAVYFIKIMPFYQMFHRFFPLTCMSPVVRRRYRRFKKVCCFYVKKLKIGLQGRRNESGHT